MPRGQNNKLYVGIDNGASGTVSVLSAGGSVLLHEKTPTRSEQSYTKDAKNITRIVVPKLRQLLHPVSGATYFVYLERPFVNPQMFKASLSAIRALEATLIAIEELQDEHGVDMRYSYIDSKEWQKVLLPAGLKGSDVLKKAAVDVARRLFPHVGSKDADSLLIAEYGRRRGL